MLKDTGTVSAARITLEREKGSHGYTGICEIEAPNGRKGIYNVRAEAKSGMPELHIEGTDWGEKPLFFLMFDFDGAYDTKTGMLESEEDSGIVFTLKRE